MLTPKRPRHSHFLDTKLRCRRALPRSRSGVTPAEVLVTFVVVMTLVLVVLMWLPRQRETSRTVTCRRNLSQIGIAIALYDNEFGTLPRVPKLAADTQATGGPVRSLLEGLRLPDFSELSEANRAPKDRSGAPSGPRPLRGLVCPSDLNSAGAGFTAPISYRATTGPGPEGKNGPFAPGELTSLAKVEAGNGRGYTAGFAERLLGHPGTPGESRTSYSLVSGPLGEEGCPPGGERLSDAGSSWAEASWRSTLYNHGLRPNRAPSCVASDGSAAFMGASSGHAGGVNVLILDLSVRTVSPTIALPVWKALGTMKGPEATPDTPLQREQPKARERR